MPPDFQFPSDQVDVYIPYSTIPDDAIPRRRGVRILRRWRVREGVAARRGRSSTPSRRGSRGSIRENGAYDAVTVEPLQEAVTGQREEWPPCADGRSRVRAADGVPERRESSPRARRRARARNRDSRCARCRTRAHHRQLLTESVVLWHWPAAPRDSLSREPAASGSSARQPGADSRAPATCGSTAPALLFALGSRWRRG